MAHTHTLRMHMERTDGLSDIVCDAKFTSAKIFMRDHGRAGMLAPRRKFIVEGIEYRGGLASVGHGLIGRIAENETPRTGWSLIHSIRFGGLSTVFGNGVRMQEKN